MADLPGLRRDRKSCTRLVQALRAEGATTKRGRPLTKSDVYRIVSNRVYLGEAVHKGTAYPGEHDAIVTPAQWDAVHAILQVSPRVRVNRTRNTTAPLLRGLIFDSDGHAMSPSHSRGRGGKIYRYYVSQAVLKGGATERPAIARLPAGEIEAAVIAQVRALLRQPEMVVGTWRAARTTAPDVTEQEVLLALERIEPLWDELFPAERARIVRLLVDRGRRRPGRGRRVAAAARRARQPCARPRRPRARGWEGCGMSGEAQTLTVVIPLRVKPRGGRKAMHQHHGES